MADNNSTNKLTTYEVKFICRDDYQYTSQDITNYHDYTNPLGKNTYIHAKSAVEALAIAINNLIEKYTNTELGYEVADYYGNYLLLINRYSEYLEFQRGIAVVISPAIVG